MRFVIRPVVLVLTALLIAACGDETVTAGAGDPAGVGGDTIEGRYVATEVTENDQPRTLVEDTTVRLRLLDGVLSTSAGCNTIGGDYTIVDGVLQLDAVTMTETGCDPPRTEQDHWLVDFLSSRPEMEPTEDGFVLRTDAAVITFVDHSIAEPDLDLVGTIWLVDGYLDGSGPDAAVSSATGDTARLVFDGTGHVTGDDGCNDFGYAGEPGQESTDGLRYELDGDHITFSGAAVTTDIACPDGDTDPFWAVLSGTVTWNIDGSRLTLLDETGKGVTYRAQP